MRTTRLLSAIVGFVALLGTTTVGRADEYVVTPRMVDDRKAVFGTVESVHETQARARIAGTLIELTVIEGDKVDAGQRIALVQDKKLVLQLAEIDARMKSLRAQRAQAELELTRMTQLRKSGTVAQAQLDQVQTNVSVIDGQQAAMAASRALVLEQQAEGAVLSPVAGRILKVNAIAGAYVMPGEVIAGLATQTYVLRIYLPERHARFIKAGDPVQVGAQGLSSTAEELREGRIRLVYPALDRGRVVADVEVAGLGDFFVGERTRVYVATGKRQTMILPRAFVYRRYGVYYVRLKGGEEIPVQPGEAQPGGIEILSGLKAGDVLTSP